MSRASGRRPPRAEATWRLCQDRARPGSMRGWLRGGCQGHPAVDRVPTPHPWRYCGGCAPARWWHRRRGTGLPGVAPGISHAPMRVVTRRYASRCRARLRQRCASTTTAGALPPIEGMMGRHRSGRPREAMLHADAARLLAAADYPPSVKQTILLALRGGRPGKQTCLACSRRRSTANFGCHRLCYRRFQTRGSTPRSTGSVRRIMASSPTPRSSPCSDAVAGAARARAERGRLADLRTQRKRRRHGAA